jgi:hypothetical protein
MMRLSQSLGIVQSTVSAHTGSEIDRVEGGCDCWLPVMMMMMVLRRTWYVMIVLYTIGSRSTRFVF